MKSKTITNLADLCDYFCADEPHMLNKRIYKGTDCGASISIYVTHEVWHKLAEKMPPKNTYESPPRLLPFKEYAVYNAPWILERGDTVGIHCGDAIWNAVERDTPVVCFTIQTIVEGSDAEVNSEPFALPVPTETINKWCEYMEDEANSLWHEANDDNDEEVAV